MPPVMGVPDGRLGIKQETTEGTAVTVDTLLEVVSGDIGLIETDLHARGMAGSRSNASGRTRANTRRVSGTVGLQPNAAELAVLYPLISGAAATGVPATTYSLAETLFGATIVKKVDNGTDGKVFTYNGCRVSRATFSAEAGGPLALELEFEGRDETVAAAGTFPALTLNVATGPFIMSDSNAAITVAGAAYAHKSYRLTIDNMLDTERFTNNAVRQAIPTRGRIVTVELGPIYGGSEAIYPTATTLQAGVAVVATFTNGTVSISFSTPKVHFPRRTPPWNGRDEFMLPLVGEARWTAAVNDELTTTLDSTP